jgi:D-threo-aldose 1-dehydrogenase
MALCFPAVSTTPRRTNTSARPKEFSAPGALGRAFLTPASPSAPRDGKGESVVETRNLAGGVLSTSALGLGCAELFSLPRERDRRFVFEAAYESGVRHFDVAPMYGLSAAEPELGRFLRGRRDDVTIATKFGIEPTLASRVLRVIQPPVRAALRRLTRLKANLKESGRGPTSRAAGRVLYRQTGYSRDTARASLERSLRAMRLDHIDVFLLHEPLGSRLCDVQDLAEYLEDERRAGRIRAWGPAGDLNGVELGDAARLIGCQVVQRRDGFLLAQNHTAVASQCSVITFGVLSGALPAIHRHVTRDPAFAEVLRSQWGLDIRNAADLVGLLLRDALRRNRDGVVLYSTTSAEHLRTAVAGGEALPLQYEAELLDTIRTAVRRT